jgi:hypothetical protein
MNLYLTTGLQSKLRLLRELFTYEYVTDDMPVRTYH